MIQNRPNDKSIVGSSDTTSNTLKTSKEIVVRFSEVDSMNIVWHGSYSLYFEDAREAFGEQFGLRYKDYYANGYLAPIVELSFKFKKPLLHGQRARVDITYRNTLAAKVIFDYEIHLVEDDSLIATGTSVQVFLDLEQHLMLDNPPFYEEWKRKHGLI